MILYWAHNKMLIGDGSFQCKQSELVNLLSEKSELLVKSDVGRYFSSVSKCKQKETVTKWTDIISS